MIEAFCNSWMFPVAYLTLGFIIGIIVVKWPGARSEDPAGTLFICTIGGPVLLPVFGAAFLVTMFFAIILKLFGIEASSGDYDSRGV